MKKQFDLKATAGSGLSKGIRDLEKCKSSNLALNVAIAEQILGIYEQISNFWGHRLAHLSNLFDSEEGDLALFEQTLVMNFAAQYLSLYASLKGLDIDKAIIDISYDAKRHTLEQLRDAPQIRSAIDHEFLRPRYFADQFNNCITDRISFHTRSIYGVPSESIYWMFENKLPKDIQHSKLLANIEAQMKQSAIKNLDTLNPR